jgi:hypothetical protein
MTQSEFQKVMDAMIEKQYRALGIDPDDPRGLRSTKRQDKLVHKRHVAEIEAKVKSDPEFRKAYLHHVAALEIAAWEADKRPTGKYREDGILFIDDQKRVSMPWATREHLLSWALQESDERNLAYIKSRLDLWEKYPECKKLEELEAAIRVPTSFDY